MGWDRFSAFAFRFSLFLPPGTLFFSCPFFFFWSFCSSLAAVLITKLGSFSLLAFLCFTACVIIGLALLGIESLARTLL